MQKYFYKDTSTGLFVIDNQRVPGGTNILVIDKNNTIVSITSDDSSKVILEPIEVTNLLKEAGTAYTDLDELLTAVKDFF
jgi:hypothetical protein